jgi:hypothetical protein
MMRSELISEPKQLMPGLKVVSKGKQSKDVLSTRTVLEELFVLLEDYAPTWYTREHHDRAIAALLQREL